MSRRVLAMEKVGQVSLYHASPLTFMGGRFHRNRIEITSVRIEDVSMLPS
jgi:hypothetical protein